MALILASTSPWKLARLCALGLEVTVCEHGVDEAGFSLGDDLRCGVERLAAAKALAVSRVRPDTDLVLGVDQLLAFQGAAFGKPGSEGEARALLHRLQGETHELLDGWALTRAHRVVASGVEVVRLTMRSLLPESIRRYVESGEWQGMAGGYRYEGMGRQLFEEIQGDFEAILGMPVRSLLPVLRRERVPGLL
jgi:nucleoside triphosphate pyrophosphatase